MNGTQLFTELREKGSGTTNEKKELALLAFNLGELTLAEQLVDELLVQDPENSVWIAYKGSLESMKGDGAPVVEAVEAVNTGFRYLDDAVRRTDGTLEKTRNGSVDQTAIDRRTTALMNRGGTAKAVPNEVFIKALQGANDYMEAAELFRLAGRDIVSADCYLNAAACFELDGKTGEAELWKREAARIIRTCIEAESNTIDEADRLLLLDVRIALMRQGLL